MIEAQSIIDDRIDQSVDERVDALARTLPVPVVGLVAMVGTMAWLLGGGVMDGAALVLLILSTVLALRIFAGAARVEPDGAVVYQLAVLAWLAKLAAMTFKLWLVFTVYNGNVDATAYHRAGQDIAATLAGGNLPVLEDYWGTEFVEFLTGLMYLVTGATYVGGWIVWSFLGTMGMLLHYKAFVIAVPHARRRLFLLLVFFAPSILVWTNSVGKDALMAFFLGLLAYASARTARDGLRPGIIALAAFGFGMLFLVRPHVGAIAAVALAAVFVLRPIRAGMLTPFIRLATAVGVAGLAYYVVLTSASFIGVETFSLEGVTEFLEVEQTSSEAGGAAFEATLPTTPQSAAIAFVTVLFRPFPWESVGVLMLASAMEGVMLMLLLLWRIRSVVGAYLDARGNAYLAYAAVYVPLFIVFFSAISNFGILVRQRVQLLPFLFILVAYERLRRRPVEEPDFR